MKKNKLNMVVAIALCVSLGLSSCIGSFKLTNKVLGWNEGVGNKFVNELVFIAFHIIPVYELPSVATSGNTPCWSPRAPSPWARRRRCAP